MPTSWIERERLRAATEGLRRFEARERAFWKRTLGPDWDRADDAKPEPPAREASRAPSIRSADEIIAKKKAGEL